MPFPDPSVIATAADLCLRPWRHGVVVLDDSALPDELCLRLECRDGDGSRQPGRDLELELYRSGRDLHLMLSWPSEPEAPMLWQGRHPVWMDPQSGQRCSSPGGESDALEALARRLRALLNPSG
ncbi:hypothetical protein EVJ50_04525 [Synechococcus sp. RSCCF101]|uniref:hypothetical protein n=1 Tax=Synechococcus sp. RSCCF101 TaxID=2511069 RepID=UPI001248966C|nr:hypothetical protein [Synechococcus sp. RSCCF101]QEY31626.1 hypothetical protein EVJ50_04525 [Synechococcus sp. RSCCF101]